MKLLVLMALSNLVEQVHVTNTLVLDERFVLYRKKKGWHVDDPNLSLVGGDLGFERGNRII